MTQLEIELAKWRFLVYVRTYYVYFIIYPVNYIYYFIALGNCFIVTRCSQIFLHLANKMQFWTACPWINCKISLHERRL